MKLLVGLTLLAGMVLGNTSVWAQQPAHADPLELAQQGDALAQAKLASLYLLGRDGYEANEKEAANWMLKAAEQGLVEAQVVVAAMYDSGLGFAHNVNKATQWYEKAAAQGHGTSLAILGRTQGTKASVAFNYQAMRLNAARQIPKEYAKRFLLK